MNKLMIYKLAWISKVLDIIASGHASHAHCSMNLRMTISDFHDSAYSFKIIYVALER